MNVYIYIRLYNIIYYYHYYYCYYEYKMIKKTLGVFLLSVVASSMHPSCISKWTRHGPPICINLLTISKIIEVFYFEEKCESIRTSSTQANCTQCHAKHAPPHTQTCTALSFVHVNIHKGMQRYREYHALSSALRTSSYEGSAGCCIRTGNAKWTFIASAAATLQPLQCL